MAEFPLKVQPFVPSQFVGTTLYGQISENEERNRKNLARYEQEKADKAAQAAATQADRAAEFKAALAQMALIKAQADRAAFLTKDQPFVPSQFVGTTLYGQISENEERSRKNLARYEQEKADKAAQVAATQADRAAEFKAALAQMALIKAQADRGAFLTKDQPFVPSQFVGTTLYGQISENEERSRKNLARYEQEKADKAAQERLWNEDYHYQPEPTAPPWEDEVSWSPFVIATGLPQWNDDYDYHYQPKPTAPPWEDEINKTVRQVKTMPISPTKKINSEVTKPNPIASLLLAEKMKMLLAQYNLVSYCHSKMLENQVLEKRNLNLVPKINKAKVKNNQKQVTAKINDYNLNEIIIINNEYHINKKVSHFLADRENLNSINNLSPMVASLFLDTLNDFKLLFDMKMTSFEANFNNKNNAPNNNKIKELKDVFTLGVKICDKFKNNLELELVKYQSEYQRSKQQPLYRIFKFVKYFLTGNFSQYVSAKKLPTKINEIKTQLLFIDEQISSFKEISNVKEKSVDLDSKANVNKTSPSPQSKSGWLFDLNCKAQRTMNELSSSFLQYQNEGLKSKTSFADTRDNEDEELFKKELSDDEFEEFYDCDDGEKELLSPALLDTNENKVLTKFDDFADKSSINALAHGDVALNKSSIYISSSPVAPTA